MSPSGSFQFSPRGTGASPKKDDGIYVPPPRKSKWEEPWFRWSVLGVAAIILVSALGASFLLRGKPESDYIAVYLTDVPGDFSKVVLTVDGVFVDEQGYSLRVATERFDILEHQGPEHPVLVGEGYVPHGSHNLILVSFSHAEGLLGETWMPLEIPKKMLRIDAGFDFGGSDKGQGRAGAILIDLDMDCSLQATAGGLIFQPCVPQLYFHDFNTGDKTDDDAERDLPTDGFTDIPKPPRDVIVIDDPKDPPDKDTSTSIPPPGGGGGGDDPCEQECSTPPVPECDDGLDNDGDGKIDFPDDPDCTTPSDNSEAESGPGTNYFPTFPVGDDSGGQCSDSRPPATTPELDAAGESLIRQCQSYWARVVEYWDLVRQYYFDNLQDDVTWIVQTNGQGTANAINEATPSSIGTPEAADQFWAENLADYHGLVQGRCDGVMSHTVNEWFLMVATRLEAFCVAQDDRILYVEADTDIEFSTFATGKQAIRWNPLEGIAGPNAPLPPVLPYDGHGVGVAIIDTGVDATHPDLGFDHVAERAVGLPESRTQAGGLNPAVYENFRFVAVDVKENVVASEVVRAANTDTTLGHGTHVAGIIAGQRPGTVSLSQGADANQVGLAPGAKLYVWALGTTGNGMGLSVSAGSTKVTLAGVLAAMDDVLTFARGQHRLTPGGAAYVPDPPVKIVHNSWQTTYPYDPNSLLYDYVDALVAEGILVTFAAGNNGGDGTTIKTSPQCQHPTEGVLCVGNFEDADFGEPSGTVYPSSARGKVTAPPSWPDVVAPGTRILSTRAQQGTMGLGNAFYAEATGTTQAAAVASACAALMISARADAHPDWSDLTPAQIEYVFEQQASEFESGGAHVASADYRYNGSHYAKGHGVIDCQKAVAYVVNNP